MTFYFGDKFEGAESLYAKLGKLKKSVACLHIDKLDDVYLKVLREIFARQYAKVREHRPSMLATRGCRITLS